MATSSKPGFCVNSIIAKTLESYVQVPDYSDLRDEIENHTFVQLKRQLTPDARGIWHLQRYKILFVTSDTVIVEETELTCGCSRFQVRKIDLSEWDQWFDEYIDEGEGFVVQEMCWADGMRMYGAEV